METIRAHVQVISGVVIEVGADTRLWLTGRTAEHKKALARAGGVWKRAYRCWILPAGTDLGFLRRSCSCDDPMPPS